MNEIEREKFVELYDIVKNLETVKCRLTHERVQIDKVTNLPVSRHIPEKIYDRIGLCRHETRTKRVSCGHTSAHLPLLDAIKMLEAEKLVDNGLLSEFDRILNQTYQLDHKKGFAESDLAVLIERQVNRPEEFSKTDLNAIQKAIKEIEVQHDEAVDELSKVLDRVVSEMLKVIDKF